MKNINMLNMLDWLYLTTEQRLRTYKIKCNNTIKMTNYKIVEPNLYYGLEQLSDKN